MSQFSRRDFLGTTSLLAAAAIANPRSECTAAEPAEVKTRPLLTPADDFQDVSRWNPKPHTLKGEALTKAKLTTETWELDITADPFTSESVKFPATIGKPVSLDWKTLLELGKKHSVKFLKAMQCLNLAAPLGQGLWEGVPLREVLQLCGKLNNVRRIYYRGFHNDDPKQIFQSSLSYTQVMETPPGELPVFLAYRLNGTEISLERGGPVRMVVPWAHGFKSIKWLRQIFLTNDSQSNDTYAVGAANNDPESYLKTAAYLDSVAKTYPTGKPIPITGQVISGVSGVKRVEIWVRPANNPAVDITDDDPAWLAAKWVPAEIEPTPKDWSKILPKDVNAKDVLGFDLNGQPVQWPLKFGMASWSASLQGLAAGKYEVRARTVDINGFAQPEPRPYQKSGKNAIQVRRFEVTA